MTPETQVQQELEEHVRCILKLLNLDASSPDLLETPRRVIGYLQEFRQPVDLAVVLKEGFNFDSKGTGAMVIQSNIPVRMMCEHHLLPAHGTAAIGYIPRNKVVGLSKLTRVMQAAGTIKPTTQEVMTNLVADVIDQTLEAIGVMVVTKCIHTCMTVRGVNSPNVFTTVSAVRGAFMSVPAAREEFMALTRT